MRRSIRRPLLLAAAAAAVAAVVLAAVVAVNAARMPSRQLSGVPAAPAIEPVAGYADRLADAIRRPTVAGDPEAMADLRSMLAEAFPEAFEALDAEDFGESLLLRWPGAGTSRGPVLLMSHLDVVPVEAKTEVNWTHPPFDGAIADGFIWGRGALDVKSGALGLLEAVTLLLRDGFAPGSDVYLALGHDEETGGHDGNARIAEALRERGVRLRLVLDEGGSLTEGIIGGIDAPVAFVGIAEKGYATVKLATDAEGGHSSMPPPQTAVGIVAAAIARLERHPFPARIDGATAAMLDHLGPEMPWTKRAVLANRWLTAPLIARQFAAEPSLNATIRTTTAATVIRGGATPNVLPEHAEALVNFRILPGETSKSTLARVVATVADDRVKAKLIPPISEPSTVSPIDTEGYETLQRTIAASFPGAVVAPGLTMVATDSRHYAPIADGVYRFLPLRLTKADLDRIHGVDERIAVDDYAALIGFLARLIEALSGPPSA